MFALINCGDIFNPERPGNIKESNRYITTYFKCFEQKSNMCVCCNISGAGVCEIERSASFQLIECSKARGAGLDVFDIQ